MYRPRLTCYVCNIHLVLACPSAGHYFKRVLQCLLAFQISFHFQLRQVTVPRLSSVCNVGQTRNRTRKSSQDQVRRGPNPDHPSVQPLFGMGWCAVCCALSAKMQRCGVQCAVCGMQCAGCSVLCTVCKCPVCGVWCAVSCVWCVVCCVLRYGVCRCECSHISCCCSCYCTFRT